MNRSLWTNFCRTWSCHTSTQVATLTVLTATFTVIIMALLFHQNLQQILTQWGRSIQVSVYLDDQIQEDDKSKIKTFLEDSEKFSSIQFVSKTQAAKNFQEQMGNYVPDLLMDKKMGNPLPSSYELSLKSKVSDKGFMAQLKSLANKISSFSGVDEVSFGQEWVKNYASLVRGFTITSWFLIIVLLAGGLFVIGNSIRNAIFQRREEIEILELVGATPMFIKWPYIIDGLITGLLSSASALVASFFIYQWLADKLYSKLGFWALGTSFDFLYVSKILVVIGLGGLLGAIGSALTVSRISTGWAAAQRAQE